MASPGQPAVQSRDASRRPRPEASTTAAVTEAGVACPAKAADGGVAG